MVKGGGLGAIVSKKATARMKQWADKKGCHVQYQVGDLVSVKLHQILRHKGVHEGLVQRHDDLFWILKQVDKMACRLELLKKVKVHLVFHVNLLKPFNKGK